MSTNINKLINSIYDDETLKTLKSVKSISKKDMLGHIALFAYPDPKFKDSLPVYDILPLIIILAFDGTHVHGINLHYIPWTYRIQFAKNIMKELENGNLLTYTRIVSSYRRAKIPEGYTHLAYRQYLKNRIASKIKVFDETNYYEAVVNVLPKFRKQTEKEVYRNINAKIKQMRASK